MPTHTSPASFGQTPQDQLASQAAPHPRLSEGTTTRAQAERHEALWLSLAALHKDTIALGAKKPNALVSEALRISAEGLLSDCAAFTRKRNERLPVAAPDLGLAPPGTSTQAQTRLAPDTIVWHKLSHTFSA